MLNLTLADAADLIQWANTTEPQTQLPRLIRRLAHMTVAQIERIGFPADEGVQLGGWDGIINTSEGNPFVPIHYPTHIPVDV